MPNAVITIPQPVLTSGQYFKTRYRLLPSGSWSSYVNRSNAPFTLTGLSAAQYQLEVILVKVDGTNCPAVYKTFTLTGDYDCGKITFNGVIVNPTAATQEVHITYTKLSGYADPPCGWKVVYIQNGNTYTYIPAMTGSSGTIKIALGSTNGLVLYMEAGLCNGKTKRCHTQDVLYTAPPCTNAVVTIPGSLSYNGTDWFVTLNYINSTPATTVYNITYLQTSVMVPGNPPDMGPVTGPTGVAAGAAGSVTFKVHPKPYTGNLSYGGNFVDYCGKSHQWMAQG